MRRIVRVVSGLMLLPSLAAFLAALVIKIVEQGPHVEVPSIEVVLKLSFIIAYTYGVVPTVSYLIAMELVHRRNPQGSIVRYARASAVSGAVAGAFTVVLLIPEFGYSRINWKMWLIYPVVWMVAGVLSALIVFRESHSQTKNA